MRMDSRLRDMIRETRISKQSLIYPLFVEEGEGIIKEIGAMPGQKRYSPDTLPFALEEAAKAGIGNIMFFGIPNEKDPQGSQAYCKTGIVQQAMRVAKKRFRSSTTSAMCACANIPVTAIAASSRTVTTGLGPRWTTTRPRCSWPRRR